MSLSVFALVDAGSFGEILLSRKNGGIDDGKVYAIKTIIDKDTRNHHEICYNELKVLRMVCQIPFFVQLKYAFKTPRIYAYVMEYYPHGNLYKYIEKHRTLTIAEAKICAAEIVQAIAYLHERRIVYRDLKLENILISHDFHIALTDFGLATEMPKHGKLLEEAGTATYFAPEMISGKGYGFEVDWWTLGILLHEMLVGHSPFTESALQPSSKRLCELNLHSQPNFTKLQSLDGFSQNLQQFITQLLIKNPKDRLGATQYGFEQVKSHQFFTPLNWTAVKLKKYKCLEELITATPIRLESNGMPDINFPEPPAKNDPKKFHFIAPELKNKPTFLLGPTDEDIENAPRRIQLQDQDRSVDLLLKRNLFMRTDVETATNVLKQLMIPKKTVRFPDVRPQAVNIPVDRERRNGNRTENHTENRSAPYQLRSRIFKRRSTIAN